MDRPSQRGVEEGDTVTFRTRKFGNPEQELTGVVKEVYSSVAARRLGLTKSRKGGKYLVIKVPGWDRKIVKRRGQVKVHRKDLGESIHDRSRQAAEGQKKRTGS